MASRALGDFIDDDVVIANRGAGVGASPNGGFAVARFLGFLVRDGGVGRGGLAVHPNLAAYRPFDIAGLLDPQSESQPLAAGPAERHLSHDGAALEQLDRPLGWGDLQSVAVNAVQRDAEHRVAAAFFRAEHSCNDLVAVPRGWAKHKAKCIERRTR